MFIRFLLQPFWWVCESSLHFLNFTQRFQFSFLLIVKTLAIFGFLRFECQMQNKIVEKAYTIWVAIWIMMQIFPFILFHCSARAAHENESVMGNNRFETERKRDESRTTHDQLWNTVRLCDVSVRECERNDRRDKRIVGEWKIKPKKLHGCGALLHWIECKTQCSHNNNINCKWLRLRLHHSETRNPKRKQENETYTRD